MNIISAGLAALVIGGMCYAIGLPFVLPAIVAGVVAGLIVH